MVRLESPAPLGAAAAVTIICDSVKARFSAQLIMVTDAKIRQHLYLISPELNWIAE